MLMDKSESLLLLIDVQEKLTPHVIDKERLVASCKWLLKLANKLEIPIIVSEQYPSGLGSTVKPLLAETSNVKILEKVHFSCFKDESFIKSWHGIQKRQVVIAGIETHVCVLQSAINMIQAGFEVFVVVDAVSARNINNHKYAIKRMRQQGVQIVTTEMVFFEWVERAGTPKFKALSTEFIK